MKIYLAGRYLDRDYIRSVADNLGKRGFIITSNWLYGEGDTLGPVSATRDMEDVNEADMLVLFTHTPAIGYNTGGRHVEFGAAWVWGKRLVIVGPKENIFHYLPGVLELNTVEDLYNYLEETDGQATL